MSKYEEAFSKNALSRLKLQCNEIMLHKNAHIYEFIQMWKAFFLKPNNQTWHWHYNAISMEWRLPRIGKDLFVFVHAQLIS